MTTEPKSQTTPDTNPNHHTWDAVNRICLICGTPMTEAALIAFCPEQSGVQSTLMHYSTTVDDPAALARAIMATGTPERLYEIGEKFPVGDPGREACFKIAAILSAKQKGQRALMKRRPPCSGVHTTKSFECVEIASADTARLKWN